jgi:hypothetical protein
MNELLELFIPIPPVVNIIHEYTMPTWNERADVVRAKYYQQSVLRWAWNGDEFNGPFRYCDVQARTRPSFVVSQLREFVNFNKYMADGWSCGFCRHHLVSLSQWCCSDRARMRMCQVLCIARALGDAEFTRVKLLDQPI